jgi:hypothetical protein
MPTDLTIGPDDVKQGDVGGVPFTSANRKTNSCFKPTRHGRSNPSVIIQIMTFLQSLRNAHRLTRFVLVWFAVFVGVAVASPLVKPQAVHLVCSAIGGVKLVQTDAADDVVGGAALRTALNCPACLPLIAPPAAEILDSLPTGHLSHFLQPLPSARVASLLGQPWQARAPPIFFA